MGQFSILPSQLLSREDAALGRLVIDPSNPERTWHQSPVVNISAKDITLKSDLNFEGSDNLTKNAKINAHLSKAISAFVDSHRSSHTSVKAPISVTYKLQNSDDKFEIACRTSEDTRSWIQKAIRSKKKIFMITGIKTVSDSTIHQAYASKLAAGAKIEVPITQAAGAPPDPLLGDSLDVGADATVTAASSSTLGFVATGEQIYALQFRQVKYQSFFKPDVDQAFLEDKVRWQVYLSRSGDPQVEVLEVDLTDEDDAQIRLEDYDEASLNGEGVLLLKSPQSINLIDFFLPAIGAVNNTMLVDERLSSDQEWVRETCSFASNRFKAADDVRAYPPYLALIIAPFLRSLYNDLKARDLLDSGEREKRRKGSLGYEWLWGGAPQDVTLNDFADTMMRTLIASIHTTAKTVSIALIDLLSQPEYLDEFREEAKVATTPDGHVNLDKLVRLDCFLKESQRLQPVFLLTMNRIVTRPYAFNSSGLELPSGTMTSAATSAVATDPDIFKDPNSFDGHRFLHLRQENAAAERSQACPARFSAVVQMKLMISKLLVGWDMTLMKNGEKYHGKRPQMEYFDFSVVAPSQYGIELAKR